MILWTEDEDDSLVTFYVYRQPEQYIRLPKVEKRKVRAKKT